MRVADFVANFIYEELNVQHVFTVTGAGIMHLTDGLISHKKLKTICPHHEQTASMALEAYSRATENFGVGIFTTGPGCTNTITGLAGAWQDSVPCLFISGQVKKSEASANSGIKNLRQFGVQELDIIPIIKSITKSSQSFNREKAKKVVQSCEFSKMQKMEKEKGFPEAVMNKNESKKISFFHLGAKNNYKELLDTEIVDEMNSVYKDQLKEFNYE